MKKVSILLQILGLFLILAVFSSCKKDDDSNCITCTYTDGTETDKICDDADEFKESGLTWDQYVALIKAFDDEDDDMSCK